MKILRYRFTSFCIYPSIEGEVAGDDGKISYVNLFIFETRLMGIITENDTWVYKCPLDKVDFDDVHAYLREDPCAFIPAVRALEEIWDGISEEEKTSIWKRHFEGKKAGEDTAQQEESCPWIEYGMQAE